MRYEDLDLCTLSGKKVIIKSPKNCGIGGAWVEGIGDVNAGGMNIPVRGKKIIKDVGAERLAAKGITVEPDFSYAWFSYGYPETAVILSKESTIALNEFSKKRWEKQCSDIRAQAEEQEKRLEETVPGVKILREAYRERASYHEAFNRAMEDEYNDGVNMPKHPNADIEALEAQYPRAVVYIRADGYCSASHDAKASAGAKAKALLEEGGSIEEAEKILDTWTEGLFFD